MGGIACVCTCVRVCVRACACMVGAGCTWLVAMPRLCSAREYNAHCHRQRQTRSVCGSFVDFVRSFVHLSIRSLVRSFVRSLHQGGGSHKHKGPVECMPVDQAAGAGAGAGAGAAGGGVAAAAGSGAAADGAATSS